MTAQSLMTIDETLDDSEFQVEMGEAIILDGLRRCDRRYCEWVVRKFAPRMLVVARRFLRCEHDAADAVQEAFISAFKAIDSFDGDSRLSTWLHRIVVNACLMRLRSKKSRREMDIDELLPAFDGNGRHYPGAPRWREDLEDPLVIEETRTAVRSAIDKLPDSYRSVLMLRDIEGLDTQETARALDCTVANVKVRLHRARQALKTLLDPILSEPASPRAANPYVRE